MLRKEQRCGKGADIGGDKRKEEEEKEEAEKGVLG